MVENIHISLFNNLKTELKLTISLHHFHCHTLFLLIGIIQGVPIFREVEINCQYFVQIRDKTTIFYEKNLCKILFFL